MVEIIKIMVTSLERSHAIPIAPNPAAGHCRPTPLLGTPEHSQASLGQSLVGSLLLSPGSWYAQDFICALQESVSQSCVSSDGPMVGLLGTSSKRAKTYQGLRHPEPLPLQQSNADLYLCRRHSNTVLSQSLWGLWVLVHTRFV